eukprot:1156793-Pelagomonas_calceolata.AAC.8
MEGRGKPVQALLTPFPATLSSTERAIEKFEELELYMHFIAFFISDRRTEQPAGNSEKAPQELSIDPAFINYFFQGLVKGPALCSAIHRAPKCSIHAPKGRGCLSDMGCTEAEGFGATQLAGGGNWEHACMRGSRANWPPGRVDGPHSHNSQSRGSRGSCCTKPGGQVQGAWVGSLSEPMEVSEDTTDETMKKEGE